MIKLLYVLAALLVAVMLVDMGRGRSNSHVPTILPVAETPTENSREGNLEQKPQSRKKDTSPKPAGQSAGYQQSPSKNAGQQRDAASDVCPAPRAGDASTIMHFGQPIRLNGANLAWSRDIHYSRDVGTESLDISAFKSRFAQIAAAGGNSARWWMHTNGTVTPNIDASGRVLGLSAQRTNSQVVDQVQAILDAAWAEGILLNITLFSFDLMCQQDRLGAHEAMLGKHAQSYFDNALTPLVRGLKDHPALLAWEIFNESEGMAAGSSFFGDPNLQGCAAGRAQPTRVFQRFVNLAAEHIHAIDPNVKVTTSVGHPFHLKDYTNRALTQASSSRPGGVLDFYQIHWYSEDYSPFSKTAASYGLDRPIIVGEYGASDEQTSAQLFENGYAGAWMWSQTSESRVKVSAAIKSGKVCAPRVNKAAIEACIQSQSAACYK